DRIFAWMTHFSQNAIIDIGEDLGIIGVTFASLALLYYIVRALIVYASKRGKKLSPGIDSFLKTLVTFLRLFHPTAGSCALIFLASHGYTIFLRSRYGAADILTLSGITTFSLILALGALGFLLYRSPADRQYRTIHRFIAIVCASVACVHIIVVTLLA
ncbi:MAG TPA: hypothetical protein VF857_01440, partial [Spirochaetota bacterium]